MVQPRLPQSSEELRLEERRRRAAINPGLLPQSSEDLAAAADGEQPAPDMGGRILPREQRANREYAERFRAGAPRGALERAEIASLPLAAWSPATLGGTALGTAMQEGASAANMPVPVQIGAGILGGVLGGSPQAGVRALAMPATKATGAALPAIGRSAVRAADETLNVAQGRQVAHAATEDPFLDEIARLAQETSPSGDWVRAKDLYRRYRASGGTLSTADFTRKIRQTAGPDAPIETLSVSRPGQEKGWLSYPRPNGYSDYLGAVRARQPDTRLPPSGGALPPHPPTGSAPPTVPQPNVVSRAPTDVERRFLRVQIGQRLSEAKRKLAASPQDAGLQAGIAKLEGDRQSLIKGTYAVTVDPSDPAEKLSGLIQQAGTARADTAALYTQERGRRLAKAIRASKAAGPNEKLRAFRSQLGGELPKKGLTPIVDGLEPTDIESLNSRIWDDTSPLNWYEKGNAAEALQNLLLPDVAKPPRDFEIELLERVFGPKLGDALRMTRGNWGKTRDILVDVLGIPKTLRSSFDLSAPMRQGVFLAPRHPKEWAGNFANMFKAMASDEASVRIYEDILNDSDFTTLVGSVNPRNQKLAILDPLGTTKGLADREEFFVSRFIQRIPGIGLGVRGSERAYVTFLNKLRYDIAKTTLKNWKAAGVEATPERVESMTRWLNIATGRGELGRVSQFTPELTAVFWSPRLAVSRYQVPVRALRTGAMAAAGKEDVQIAKMMAQDLASFVAAGGTILFAIHQSGLAKTELDPRSANFGKLSLKGGVAIDFWGGFQQAVRYAAQFATGERKPSTTTATKRGVKTKVELPVGEDTGIEKVDPGETAFRFIRSKLAPGIPTMAGDELYDRTFIGTPLNDRTKLFGMGPDVQVRVDEYAQQLVPLFELQLAQAMDQYGISKGLLIAAPGAFGVGIQTRNDLTPSVAQPERAPSGKQPVAPGIFR